MSDEETTAPPPLPEKRKQGRPKGSKDSYIRSPHGYTKAMRGHGHLMLRGAGRLQVLKDIKQRVALGETIAEIETSLKLAKGSVFRDLYGPKAKELVKAIIDEATIDSLLIFAELMETIKSEAVHMKTLSATGELRATPEQLGTLMRAAEKTLEISKMINGRGLSIFGDAQKEAANPELNAAERRLKILEAQGVKIDD